MASRAKSKRLVRYVSPFGSPAWMTEEQAMSHFYEDDVMYEKLADAGVLSQHQREIGPPRIERDR